MMAVTESNMVHWRHLADTELLSYIKREEDGHHLEEEISLTVNSPQMLTFLNMLPSPNSLELGIYRTMLLRTHSRAFKVKRNRQ